MNKTTDDLYRQMGIAALLPGLQRAVEALQAQVDEYRAALAEAQAPAKRAYHRKVKAEPEASTVTKQGIAKMAKGIRGYWAQMTPEERSAEIRRRMAKGLGHKPEKALHPRDLNHPDHEAWVKKSTATNRKYWASLPPRVKKERVAKMLASRLANQRVNGKEQVAS